MRILFTSTAGLGHVLPVVAVARLAAAAGHEVAVASPAGPVQQVRAAGLAHVQVDGPIESQVAAMRREIADPGAQAQQMFCRLKPRAALPGLDRILAHWQPHVVVSEAADFGGGLAAAVAGRPWVRVHPGALHGWLWERMSAALLNDLRVELGLAPDPEARWLTDVPQLCRIPTEFDTAPTEHRPVSRWRLGEPPPVVPDQDRDQIVYITFGTEISGMPPFPDLVRAAVTAVRAVGLHPLISIHHADPGLFANLDGATVLPWVEQDAVLARARAVIFHGGAGTLLGALTAGTPSLVVPFFADQPHNAARLAELGAGRNEPPGPDLADRLTAGLTWVLTERAPACAQLARAVRELPGPATAVEVLEQAVELGEVSEAVVGGL